MTGRDEQSREAREEAEWRSIVENFGERAELPDPEPPQFAAPDPGPVLDEPVELREVDGDDEDHFIPPDPPPVPRPEGVRLAAWSGLFGVPVIALLAIVVNVSLPSLVSLLLIAWFVGGFGYLVATMSGRDPDSGWDDGAVL